MRPTRVTAVTSTATSARPRGRISARVGSEGAHGVGPLIVHRDSLYAATWNYDWTRVHDQDLEPCRVYRYDGPGRWEDCGQPGVPKRLFSLASYRGDLLAVGDDATLHVHRGGVAWEQVMAFDTFAHPVTVHDGRLVLGMLQPATVRSFDGREWDDLGNPDRRSGALRRDPFARHVPRGAARRHVAARPRGSLGRADTALAPGGPARRQHRGDGAERLQRQALRRRDPARRGLPLRARSDRGPACAGSSRRRAGDRCWSGTCAARPTATAACASGRG